MTTNYKYIAANKSEWRYRVDRVDDGFVPVIFMSECMVLPKLCEYCHQEQWDTEGWWQLHDNQFIRK